jgi:hypothetical protein
VSTVELAPPDEVWVFLELVREGAGEINAAYSVNWTGAKLKRLMKDPDFIEMITEAKGRRIEQIEEVAYKMAMRGNVRCIELTLFCQAADRGWKPPAQRHEVNQTGRIDVDIVMSVQEAARQMLQQGTLGQLSAPIIDAEVVDDVDDQP